MNGAVVGISAYLDPVPRAELHGSIKKEASDFIVQEITNDGLVLALGDDWDHAPSPSSRDDALKAMVQVYEAKKQRTKEALAFDPPTSGWRHELQLLLKDESLVEQLERVAGDSGIQSNASLCLDAPSEFRDRVYLQVCIQTCFPALDCRIKKMADDNSANLSEDGSALAPQIEVAQDGLYKKFVKAGLSTLNASRLIAFVRKGANDRDAAAGLELDHEDSKEARSAIHRQISAATSLLRTRTETRESQQRIVAFFSPQNSKKRKRMDDQPEPYVRFVLEKTNLEHFTCVETLSRYLKRPVSAFGFAGTKDKVAITYQHVTVQGVTSEQLLSINSDYDKTKSSGLRVGHLQYATSPLSLGILEGNRFTIRVRDLPSDIKDNDISSRVTRVATFGFLNYFGFQRVGLPSSSVRQHQIGQLMVAGEWQAAVEKLFEVTTLDPPECARAKAAYLSNRTDPDAALKLVPMRSMQAERALLVGLKRYGATAYEAAINAIPFGRRTMYLHAYQSYLFNVIASRRATLSHCVLEGDLVSEENGGPVVVATAELAAALNDRLEHPLDCVMLPLPGSSVLYPTNEVGDKLQQVMTEHGTTTALMASTDLKGAYRALVMRPKDIEWRRVDDTAIELTFSLGSGSFATMCLREILHIDL